MDMKLLRPDSTTAGVVVAVVVITVLFVEIRKRILNPSRLPVFNDRKWYELGYGKATGRYIADPEGLIRKGLKIVGITSFVQLLLVW